MIHIQLLTPEIEFLPIIRDVIEIIWPPEYAKAAYQATAEDAYLNPIGQVYAIRHHDTYSHRVHLVGITGIFLDERKDVAYLRWTGILPEYRRKGIFAETIRQLTLTMRGMNPDIKHLVELVPDNEYGHIKVIPAFERVGFVRDDSFVVPKGEDDEWDCIPYVLNF